MILKILHTIALFVIGCKSNGVLHHVPQVLDTKRILVTVRISAFTAKRGKFYPSLLQTKAWKHYFGKNKKLKVWNQFNIKGRLMIFMITHHFGGAGGKGHSFIISECLQVAILTVEISSLGMLCHQCPQSSNNTILPLVCVNKSSPTV